MDTANIAAVTGGVLSFDWKQCYAVTTTGTPVFYLEVCFSHVFMSLK